MSQVYFEEIQVKSVINRVQAPDMGLKWTINPYRGCQHACVYCFARKYHLELGYNPGTDFNTRIIVKVNAPQVAREQLRSPGWKHEHILLGAACDPWQQAEARYGITREILKALLAHQNSISILTKSTLILRDADLLADLAKVAEVQVNFSVGTLDEAVWQEVEPETPKPSKRIEAMGRLVELGVPAGVMLAPIIPGLSDDPASLEAVIRAAAEQGANHVSPVTLHLRPGAKEWFMPFLRETYPYLEPRYAQLYKGAYAPHEYTEAVARTVQQLKRKWGFDRPRLPRPTPQPRGQMALAL